jgi:hypothetical protein
MPFLFVSSTEFARSLADRDGVHLDLFRLSGGEMAPDKVLRPRTMYRNGKPEPGFSHHRLEVLISCQIRQIIALDFRRLFSKIKSIQFLVRPNPNTVHFGAVREQIPPYPPFSKGGMGGFGREKRSVSSLSEQCWA